MKVYHHIVDNYYYDFGTARTSASTISILSGDFIGNEGTIQKEMTIGEVILVMSASGDSGANMTYFNGMHYAATADFDLLLKAYEVAKKLNIKTHQGSVFSTNTFYDAQPNR